MVEIEDKKREKYSNPRMLYFQCFILLLKTIEQGVLQIISYTYLSLHISLDPG